MTVKRSAPFVALLLLGFALLLPGTPARALPTNELEIWYLDTNGYVVGNYFRGCGGERISEGQITQNALSYSASCASSWEDVSCIWAGTSWSCAANMFWNLCTLHYPEELCSMP